MPRPRPLARPGLFLAVAALLPALAAVLSGTVHVTRCVSVPGGIAHVGLNLALLRPAAECPTTGVALGGESEQVLAAVVLLTAPMLLLHAGVLAGSWGVGTVVRRSLARLARLTPWHRQPAPRPIVVPARPATAVGTLTVPAWRTPAAVPLLRGPPAALPA
ncbi:hypothetical protein [Georgenia satyanarayanai]|uniref:hypothetical protein n=1 Tax=Georgenia satyanarayanai TaxID=860221 RepID=UPI00126544B0|nr:hypothetical protein [Georgenia satyanarayanai]